MRAETSEARSSGPAPHIQALSVTKHFAAGPALTSSFGWGG